MIASRRHASGLAAAISLKPAHSSASRTRGRHRLAQRGAQRGLDDRVLRGRDGEPGGDLDRRDDVGGGDEHVVRRARPVCSVSDARVRDPGAEVAVLGFTAHDQRDVEIAARDGEARTRERASAGGRRTRRSRCGRRHRIAGQQTPGIAVTPRAARHEDRLRRGASNDTRPARSHACAMRSIASSAASGSSTCWWATPAPTSTGVRGSRPRAYFRWKFGVRFSANAFGPSLASSDAITASPCNPSRRRTPRPRSCAAVSCSVLRIASTASGPFAAISPPISRALASACAVGHDVADRARSPSLRGRGCACR